MTLKMNEEESMTLLHIVSLAAHVLAVGDEVEPDMELQHARRKMAGEIAQIHHFINKVYTLADSAGMPQIAEFDDELGGFIPTDQYAESGVYPLIIKSFETSFFWQQLAAMLSERDLEKFLPAHTDPITFEMKQQEREDFYFDLFGTHGIRRLYWLSDEING
jgi:hypothetical protein